jgi:MoaA/NifB/PqqE/SkfB family radical SAM enzyme
MELPVSFKNYEYLESILETFNGSLPSPRTKDLTTGILGELFLRPYLPSKELCKFGIGKEDLKGVYAAIRSSEKARELFEFSPYHYLVQVLEHLSKDSERTSKIVSGETPFPLSETMELFISEFCNAKCKFCYRNGNVYDEGRVLSTQEYVNLIHEFADLQGANLDVSGGLEPLLSPSILDVLKAGLDRKLKVSLYTNGIAMSNPDLMGLLVRIHKVRISLNAYDRESYQEVNGVNKFDVVLDNLRNLVKTKEDSKSEVRIGINLVVLRENYTHIFDAIKLAQEIGVDFLDLRSVEVTDFAYFDGKQVKELGPILKQIRRENLLGEHGKLSVSVGDTFGVIIDPNNDPLKYSRKEFVNALPYYRVNVTPQGKIYALNVIAQPSREDQRYLFGETGKHSSLYDILSSRKIVPFEPKLLLSHDISLISALSKLESDLEFGISLEENPFNWD